jgi:branched-subunit amino acid ABC-type transport system permease component
VVNADMYDQRLVYIGILFSILSRLTFAVLLYRNQSRKRLSMIVCLCTVISNGFWFPYVEHLHARPLILRSIIEMVISSWGVLFILRNRYRDSFSESARENMIHCPHCQEGLPTHH